MCVTVAKDVCQSEDFEAECWQNEVIVMTRAMYGRMRVGRCAAESMGHIGCSGEVLPLLDRWCSGRQKCLVNVPNKDLDRTRPCPSELKTYLEATYTCVRGECTLINLNQNIIILIFRERIRSRINFFPLSYLNFDPLEVVSRCRDPQLQVCEKYSYLFNVRSIICKS